MRLKKSVIVVLCSLLCSTHFSASAIDLGVKARVYEISEIDMRIYMLKAMAENFDLEDHKKMMLKKSDEYYSKLPRFPLELSRNHVVNYIDPTKVYEEDFWGLVDGKDGKPRWAKISKAGHEVNWLEYSVSPMPIYFIFDYTSEPQREMAKELVKHGDPAIKLVFTGGDVKQANRYLNYPLTYLNKAMVAEYDVYYTPTLITRGAGKNINHYKSVRFDVDDLTLRNVLDEISK